MKCGESLIKRSVYVITDRGTQFCVYYMCALCTPTPDRFGFGWAFYRCGNTITIDHRQSLIADQIRERSTIFQFRKQTECTADTADWFDGHLHECLRLKTLKTCARSVRRSTVSLNMRSLDGLLYRRNCQF